MMALGDELGADHDIETAGGDVGEFLAHALDGGDQIAREHEDSRLWKQRAHLLFQPLDAGADRNESISRPTFWTSRRMRHGEAAMVADELAAKTMIDQPGVAVRTGEA